MDEEKKKAYSEVVEVLKLIENEEKIEKIPFETIELIKRNSDPSYKPNISKEIAIEEQSLRNETYAILAWIANKYWGEEIEEVKHVNNIEAKKDEENKEIIEEKKEEYKSEIRNASVYNDIEPECLGDYLETSNLPAIVNTISWYQKIKTKVIKLLKIIFRVNKESNEEGAD